MREFGSPPNVLEMVDVLKEASKFRVSTIWSCTHMKLCNVARWLFSRKKHLHLRCLFKGTLPLNCEFAISHHQRSLDGVAREWRYVLASQFRLLFVGERSFHMFPPSNIIETKKWNVLILLMWHFVLIDIPHVCCLTHLGELYFTKPNCLVILKHLRNILSWSSEVKG